LTSPLDAHHERLRGRRRGLRWRYNKPAISGLSRLSSGLLGSSRPRF
jgi:hypothetical protein